MLNHPHIYSASCIKFMGHLLSKGWTQVYRMVQDELFVLRVRNLRLLKIEKSLGSEDMRNLRLLKIEKSLAPEDLRSAPSWPMVVIK
ncbi:hypothetical protein L6452_35035 [Arctium lappa]|uniref:Uncharacterized protein n=1 Tax=Arctium lappa TaxID=4217 RepID=A0ACB8YJ65_ARCLA|nr:hypothetical protein L6452_35035 [Arctium lappa]